MSDTSNVKLESATRLQLLYEHCFQQQPMALRDFIDGLVRICIESETVTGSLVAFGMRVRSGDQVVVYKGKSPKSVLRAICAALSGYSAVHGFPDANPYGGTFLITVVIDGIPHSIDVETENTMFSQWFQIRCVDLGHA